MNEVAPRESGGEFLLYQTEDGRVRIETRMQEETVWLTQDQMALLFGKAKSTINEHIKNIFKEGELVEDQVMRRIGNSEFSTKPTHYYNPDVIISVGYRVKSLRGTQFRIWATQRLREYIIKGFAKDDERLKEAGGLRQGDCRRTAETTGLDPFQVFDSHLRSLETGILH
jgi:hypothetical protein